MPFVVITPCSSIVNAGGGSKSMKKGMEGAFFSAIRSRKVLKVSAFRFIAQVSYPSRSNPLVCVYIHSFSQLQNRAAPKMRAVSFTSSQPLNPDLILIVCKLRVFYYKILKRHRADSLLACGTCILGPVGVMRIVVIIADTSIVFPSRLGRKSNQPDV